MTLDFIRSHVPDLVTELAPDHRRRCRTVVQNYGTPTQRRCSQPARWQVKGHAPQCGIHAARSLRRELQADLAAVAEP